MTRTGPLRWLAAATLLALCEGAPAHHSLAGYDDEVSEMEGALVGIDWRNPHIRMELSVVDDDGAVEVWSMDANSIYNLRRAGVERELFEIGDSVRVAGHKSRRGDLYFQLTNMLFADGREVILWGGTDPRWRDSYIGGKDLLTEKADPQRVAADGRGIFRVWSVPRGTSPATHLPFTERAVAARAGWNLFDNFAIRCEPEGMPRIMINPHPFEFIDEGDRIVLRTEFYDIRRTIHMGREEPPADEPASPLGYSVGRWEDGVLVVETTRINWPYFDNSGTPQSEAVEIVERFSLNGDQARLDFHITIIDPETFTEPATIQSYWEALGDVIPEYDCQPDRPR